MRLTRLSASAAIAGALAAPLILAGTASATTGTGTGSAYGLAASGLVAIPATPAVAATADKSQAELPANPLIDVKLLHTTAEPGRARAAVTDLSVAKAALTAHLITATCKDGRGTSHLVKAKLAGHRLAVDAAPNSVITVPVQGLGTASVTLNKQTTNADGSLTVTAIEATLPLPAGRTQTISVSSATCSSGAPGNPPGSPTGKPTPAPPATGSPVPAPPGQAPKPTPVPGDLPVTG